MVEADPELAESFRRRRLRVLVQPDERAVAEHVHGVVHVGISVFVDHRVGVEELFVPGNADRQIAHGERDVRERRKGGHGVVPFGWRDCISNQDCDAVRVSE